MKMIVNDVKNCCCLMKGPGMRLNAVIF